MAAKIRGRFTTAADSLSNFGTTGLCFSFRMNFSSARSMAGRRVTLQMTPIRTPFASTMPMSIPRRKVMKHRARNPAMVVSELLEMETSVFAMAFAMASSRSIPSSRRCSV